MTSTHTSITDPDPRHQLPAGLRRQLARPAHAVYSREEEQAAFVRLETARAAAWAFVLRTLAHVERPDDDQDDAALLKYMTDRHSVRSNVAGGLLAAYRAAVRDIEDHNLRLVVAIARRYLSRPGASAFTLADLIAYGCIGLRTAVLRFDLGRGLHFATYAPYWIGHVIGRAIADHGRTIRIPIHAQESMARVGAATWRLGGVTPPSDEMLAAETGLSTEVVRTARRNAQTVAASTISIHRPIRDQQGEEAGTIGDMLRDAAPALDDALADERRYGDAAAAKTLARLMAALTPTEAEIITRRAGLGDLEGQGDGSNVEAFGGGETLKVVGVSLGISRERVRQIQEQALRKMRKSARRMGLMGEAALV